MLASTDRDLRVLAAQGRFREDFFYRLAIVTIHVPLLRERGDDLPIQTRHFLGRYNREFGKDVREIEPDAVARLRAHSWPGNVRDSAVDAGPRAHQRQPAAAARMLGIARQMMRAKLRAVGFHVTHAVASDEDDELGSA